MHSSQPNVLVVDDEEFNLELISEYLQEADINPVCVRHGEHALDLLDKDSGRIDAVLLDRMMPDLDGIEVLNRIRNNTAHTGLPVIMQTAKASKDNILEGLNAGAHYYLTKPYDQETLTAIVKTAVRDYQHYQELRTNMHTATNGLVVMQSATFKYKTLDEGRNLAMLLAKACQEPDRIVVGLTELMINAVEHGNLGITYEEKSQLNETGEWEQEINRRQVMEEYRNKEVTVEFLRRDNEVNFIIRDDGEGFDWRQFIEPSADRAFDSHGRGIMLAAAISFNSVEYTGKGNEVSVTVEDQGAS